MMMCAARQLSTRLWLAGKYLALTSKQVCVLILRRQAHGLVGFPIDL
jgi:hypothetical protein